MTPNHERTFINISRAFIYIEYNTLNLHCQKIETKWELIALSNNDFRSTSGSRCMYPLWIFDELFISSIHIKLPQFRTVSASFEWFQNLFLVILVWCVIHAVHAEKCLLYLILIFANYVSLKLQNRYRRQSQRKNNKNRTTNNWSTSNFNKPFI